MNVYFLIFPYLKNENLYTIYLLFVKYVELDQCAGRIISFSYNLL